MLSVEEIGVGGSAFGLAYDPSEVTGDHGMAGKLELRIPVKWIASIGLPDVVRLQPYAYLDAGTVWNEDKAQDPEDGSRATLRSVGSGLRFDLAERMSGELNLAKPFGRRISGDGTEDWRYFFRVLRPILTGKDTRLFQDSYKLFRIGTIQSVKIKF